MRVKTVFVGAISIDNRKLFCYSTHMTRKQLNEAMANHEVADLTVDGIDRTDFPDFCDAYFASGAVYVGDGQFRDLSETELEWLSEDWGEKLSEMAHESFRDSVMRARE